MAADANRDPLFDALVGHFSGGLPRAELPPDVLESLGHELAASGLVRRELLALWNLLQDALHRARWRIPHSVRLLNLACGPCVEGAVLAALFGQGGTGSLRFFGMDLRGQQIEDARRRYAATEAIFRVAGIPVVEERSARPAVEFFADDATRLAGYREIPDAYEVIFIRHQNVWHDTEAWRRIYAFALDRLADPAGILVLTSYFDREHLIALDMLRALGGQLVVSLPNPDTIPLDYPGKSTDRHLAVIRRPPNHQILETSNLEPRVLNLES
ncbi:hypothetical protein BH23VER1_BH23VER1_00190 [soil metagenome]